MTLSRALLLFALLCHTSSAVILERHSHEPTKEVSSEEQPPPESHESKEEISSEEQPPPESHKPTKDVSSEEEPLLDSHESKEEISSEMLPPGSNEDSSELAQEEEDKMQINSTVVLPGDNDRKRRPTVPTSTPIPNCPTYVSCPWVYPQPITTESSDQTGNTTHPEERPVEEHLGAQSASISATQKPQYPPYVPGPWIYPKPIVEGMSETTSTEKPAKQEEERPIEQHFGVQRNESDSTGTIASSSENIPAPQGMNEDNEKRGTNDPGHRPTVPTSTPIPNCPSYVSCPWVYPQPITTESSDQADDHPKPVGEGASEMSPGSSLTENESNSGDKDGSTNKQEEFLEEHIGGQKNESGSSDKEGSTTTTSANRPSISATQKPQYPSYVPGPWIYPQPVGELAPEITSTNKPEEVLLEEHIGGQKNESGSSDKEGSTTTGTRPSISATQKPQYPSFVPGPWIYPQPVGELAPEITSTNKPEELLLEEHIGGQKNESGSGDKEGSTASTSGNRPSIPATQKPQYPSFVPGPWIYPQPVGELAPEITSTNKPEELLLEEHIGGQKNESGSGDKDSSTPSGNRPSISATQKPQYPSYVPGPWIYPQPVGAGVYQISTTKKPGNHLLSEHFGLLENESGSGNKVGSSASSSKPQAPFTDIPLAGSSEQMVFPGPTTRYPPKKPAKRPSLLSSLWNPEKNVMAADRFAAGIDFEDDLTDIIETYASNFFYYSPILSKRKDSPSETNKRLQAAYKKKDSPPALLVDKAYPSAGVYFLSVPMELKA